MKNEQKFLAIIQIRAGFAVIGVCAHSMGMHIAMMVYMSG